MKQYKEKQMTVSGGEHRSWAANSEWKFPENNNRTPTRRVLPSRCTPGWEVHCWRAAGGPPEEHTGVLSNYKNLLPLTWGSEVSWKQKTMKESMAGECEQTEWCYESRKEKVMKKNLWAVLLTVTNWLFSSLMMSPTWTSIHFSLRSLQTGNRLVNSWLDCVYQCVCT